MQAEHVLSADTQAILLLCGYFGDKAADEIKPLTLSEYNGVAVRLHKAGLRPEDLLRDSGGERLTEVVSDKIDAGRVRALLGRGVQLGFAVEAWARQGIWVIGRGEAAYPARLRNRLREQAPPLLYGAGNKALLAYSGVGIVGSRNADEGALAFTTSLAAKCAAGDLAVVSGGAKGVDQAAMQAALAGGGHVIGVLPEGVAREAVSRAYRQAIQEQRLVLVSPYHPGARWSTGSAMGRNKCIYALSDWTVVVSSETDGGTWSGAYENLKGRWVPLLVRAGAGIPKGNAKLLQMGGIPLSAQALAGGRSVREALELLASSHSSGDGDLTLFPHTAPDAGSAGDPLTVSEPPAAFASRVPSAANSGDGGADPVEGRQAAADRPQTVSQPLVGDLFPMVWPSLALAFEQPRSDEELAGVADSFDLQIGQLKAWVKRAVAEGVLKKLSKPARYVAAGSRQAD